MQLSQETIDEFKEIYQRTTGAVLADDEANQEALQFLRLVRFLLTPPPKRTRAESAPRFDDSGVRPL